MANPQIENGYIKIATEYYEALCKKHIPGQAMQVLELVIRKTWGWNKKEDQISLSQFVEGTGLIKPRVIEARNDLISMNMIVVTQKCNDEDLTYSVQKDYRDWKPLRKSVTLRKSVINVTQKCNKSLRKSVPTKDTNTKDTIKDSVATDQKEPSVKTHHKEAIEYFVSSYLKRTGSKYIFHGAKDGQIVSRLLSDLTIDEFKSRVDAFFGSSDEFIQKAGYTLGVFSSQINKIMTGGENSPQLQKLLDQVKESKYAKA